METHRETKLVVDFKKIVFGEKPLHNLNNSFTLVLTDALQALRVENILLQVSSSKGFTLFCCDFVINSPWIHILYLHISLRVASPVLGKSYHLPRASEVTLYDMSEKSSSTKPNENTLEHRLYNIICWLYCKSEPGNRARSQYKDRLTQVWGFPCKRQEGHETVLSLTWGSLYW